MLKQKQKQKRVMQPRTILTQTLDQLYAEAAEDVVIAVIAEAQKVLLEDETDRQLYWRLQAVVAKELKKTEVGRLVRTFCRMLLARTFKE